MSSAEALGLSNISECRLKAGAFSKEGPPTALIPRTRALLLAEELFCVSNQWSIRSAGQFKLLKVGFPSVTRTAYMLRGGLEEKGCLIKDYL